MSDGPVKHVTVNERFSQFPRALAEKARSARFGAVPALLAHPDWQSPAPTVLWMHGRTVSKELDPGRYLRFIRAGLAVCAVDLPGHGERYDIQLQHPTRTLEVLKQMVAEIDGVVAALAGAEFQGVFDASRLAIGGMSAGGMVTLRRLCEPHPFKCTAVEGTTGWLSGLYFPDAGAEVGAQTRARWAVEHDRARVAEVDPDAHLDGFRPIPLLALHSERDEVIPVEGVRRFIGDLREHYAGNGADPDLIELVTWPETGAPDEHAGFGRVSHEAKTRQVEFLVRHLR